MFRAPCDHRQEVKILTMSTWRSKHLDARNKHIVKQIFMNQVG